jgi:Flp pilus assembly protein TadD
MEASLKIFPENAVCWNELGAAHMREGNHKLAARDFRNSLSLRPNEPFTLCNYATSLSAAGDTASAEAIFSKMLASNMTMPQVHFQYGLLLERTGRLKEAAEQLGEAARLAPQSPAVSEALKRVQDGIR